MSLASTLAGSPGLYSAAGDGQESGPFVSRIEVKRLPNGGVSIDYEATSREQGVQHVEHSMLVAGSDGRDRLYVSHSESPFVTEMVESTLGSRRFELREHGGPYVMVIVIDIPEVDRLTYAWWWGRDRGDAGGTIPRRCPFATPFELSWRSGGLLEAVLAQQGWCVPRGRFLITVQNIRVEIDSVWPADGPCRAIDRNSAEGIVIVDCRQDAGERSGEIDLADKAVREDHAQLTCAEVLDPSDTNESIHARHPTAAARCPTAPRVSGRAPSFGEVRFREVRATVRRGVRQSLVAHRG